MKESFELATFPFPWFLVVQMQSREAPRAMLIAPSRYCSEEN